MRLEKPSLSSSLPRRRSVSLSRHGTRLRSSTPRISAGSMPSRRNNVAVVGNRLHGPAHGLLQAPLLVAAHLVGAEEVGARELAEVGAEVRAEAGAVAAPARRRDEHVLHAGRKPVIELLQDTARHVGSLRLSGTVRGQLRRDQRRDLAERLLGRLVAVARHRDREAHQRAVGALRVARDPRTARRSSCQSSAITRPLLLVPVVDELARVALGDHAGGSPSALPPGRPGKLERAPSTTR